LSLISKDQSPIGATVEQRIRLNSMNSLLIREADGSLRCERAAENVTIRKKFFFRRARKERHFLAEMDVDLVTPARSPIFKSGYFVALGAAFRFIRKIIPITPGSFGASTARPGS